MKFLVLYHSPHTAREQMAAATPEEAKEGMDAWMAWSQKVGSALVDFGSPTDNSRTISQEGSQESTGTVGGYSIMEAASADEVTDLLTDHPHLIMPGNSIEVLQLMPMPGM